MRVDRQLAYVLHARPWRETSVIVETLTRDHGRVGVVARGLTTPRRHSLRAALQPLQLVQMDYVARGELARLVHAEAIDAAPILTGDRLMAAFYVHELLLKLTPRNDSAQALFELYGRLRGELGGAGSLGWSLRRFERDLLDALGVGLPWGATSDGECVFAGQRYRLDPELGPVVQSTRVPGGIDGDALLALAADVQPGAQALQQLRPALRRVLEAHLGGATLRSWGLLDELARIRPTP